MNKLKPLLLIGLLLFLLPSLHAQGVQVGPWISDTGENSLTILWTSEAPGLLPVAFSPDGLVEGIVLPAKRFVWAVQWHPEYLFRKDGSSLKLFRRFIEKSGRDN